MSTLRVTLVILICSLLTGCSGIATYKGTIAIISAIVSVVALAYSTVVSRKSDEQEERTMEKAEQLDHQISEHVSKYHCSGVPASVKHGTSEID